MIQFKNLEKIFSETKRGLQSFTADILPNEWVTIMGPSGCGKTTLLKMVAGIETQTTGQLSRPFAQKEISFVFQDPALLPWKTVLENVILPLELQGIPLKKSTLAATPWIEKLKLSHFQSNYPHELSGGLKMRVSLARALITQPKLLLLDEPFAALDEPIRIQLGLELKDLWKTLKPTVLLVTHSITEGIWLADRVIVFKGQPGQVCLDQKINLGIDRPLSLRGEPEFLLQVDRCFQMLREP